MKAERLWLKVSLAFLLALDFLNVALAACLLGDQKVLLVVMHYMRKDITENPPDAKQQGTYPAVVLTVHTRYTLQDGFYPCKMNQRAMAAVADAIKKLAEDN